MSVSIPTMTAAPAARIENRNDSRDESLIVRSGAIGNQARHSGFSSRLSPWVMLGVPAGYTTAYRRLIARRTTNAHGHKNMLTSGEVQYAGAMTGRPRMPLLQRTNA